MSKTAKRIGRALAKLIWGILLFYGLFWGWMLFNWIMVYPIKVIAEWISRI